MITLDPEFVGALAPEPKLTTAVNDKTDLAFARLPRLERLRVQGKADETEDADEAGGEDGDEEGGKKKALTKADKEKKKMRGKNKTLKRYVTVKLTFCDGTADVLPLGTYANSERTSLIPKP